MSIEHELPSTLRVVLARLGLLALVGLAVVFDVLTGSFGGDEAPGQPRRRLYAAPLTLDDWHELRRRLHPRPSDWYFRIGNSGLIGRSGTAYGHGKVVAVARRWRWDVILVELRDGALVRLVVRAGRVPVVVSNVRG